MNRAILLTHGDLGQSLVRTTAKIIGEYDGIHVISNEHKSLKDLVEQLEKTVEEISDDSIIIMVDFCGGSCWHAARVVKRTRKNVALLSGVNLPLFLAYCNKRDSFKLEELAEYLKDASMRGTTTIVGIEPEVKDSESHE